MKLKKSFRINLIILSFILFVFLFKINPTKNFSEIINNKLPKRLENVYGYCGGKVLDILNI